MHVCSADISRHYNVFRYPYEAIHVVTSDGYVILLERIPRYNKFLFSEMLNFYLNVCV